MNLIRQMSFFHRFSVTLFFAVCFSVLAAGPVFAQDDDEEEKFVVSQERIDTINRIISGYVKDKQNMADPTVHNSILAEIGNEMTLKPEAEIVQGDYKKLNAQAEKQTLKKFGKDLVALEKQYTQEADAMYPMAKLRDRVSFRYRRGPLYMNVSGILYAIKKNNILVENTTVSFIDMDDQTRSRFDAELNETLRKKYVSDKLQEYRKEFSVLQQKIFDHLLKKQISQNEKNGYIYVAKTEQWKTAREIAQQRLNAEAEAYRKYQRIQEKKRLARLKKEAELKAQKEKEAEEAARLQQEQQKQQAQDEMRPGESAASGESVMMANQLPPGPDVQAEKNVFAGTIPDQAEANPQDILKGDDSGLLKSNESDTFIAMSAQEITNAMNRIQVDQATYKELMNKVDERLKIINSTYFGIDADQGFKKALWGFSERDVYYALSKEQEVAFRQKNVINRDDIIYPPGSRPSRIYLHYHLGALYKVDIYMGDLKPEEFNIYKNSLRMKYGDSDTQLKASDDLYELIRKGEITPDKIPVIINPEIDETGISSAKRYRPVKPEKPAPADGGEAKPEQTENAAPPVENLPFVFVWEGVLSRGILSFYYKPDDGIYRKVLFEKIYLPLRLKNAENAAKEAAEAAAAAQEQQPAEGQAEQQPAAQEQKPEEK